MAPRLELKVDFDGDASGLIGAIRKASAVAKAMAEDFTDLDNGVTGTLISAGKKSREFAEKTTAVTQRVGTNLVHAGRSTLRALSAGSDEALDFQKNLALLGVVSGTTGKDLEGLKDLVLSLGASTQFTAGQALQGAIELSRGGFTPLEIKSGALEAALGGAAAGIGDVGKAGEIAAVTSKLFADSLEGPSEALSLFVNTANASATNTWKLEFAVRQGALSAAEAGDTFEDFMATLGVLADFGLKGERAGTSLRAMLKDLMTPTDEAAKAINRLGLDLWDARGNFVGTRDVVEQLSDTLGKMDTQEDKTKALVGFTIEGRQAMLALVNAWDKSAAKGDDVFANKISAVRDLGTVSDIAGKLTDNAAGSLLLLQSAWSEFMIRAFIPFLDAMRPFIEDLTSFVGWLANWAKLNPGVATGLLKLTAIVGVMLVALGAAVLSLGTILGLTVAISTLAAPVVVILKAGLLALVGIISGALLPIVAVGSALLVWGVIANNLGLTWGHLFRTILFGVNAVLNAVRLLAKSAWAIFRSLILILSGDVEGLVALWKDLAADWGAFFTGIYNTMMGQLKALLLLFEQVYAFSTGGDIKVGGVKAELGPAAEAARARRVARLGEDAADPTAFRNREPESNVPPWVQRALDAAASRGGAPSPSVTVGQIQINGAGTPEQTASAVQSRIQQIGNN